MGYRTLLAILDTPKTTGQVTDFAVAFANQFQGHVIGAHAEAMAMVPLVAPMEIPDPVTVQALQDMAHRETEAVETLFLEIARRENLSHEWRSFVSARSADLVIAAQSENGILSESRSDLESFLFESGRPVLLIPHILKSPQPIRKVLIAWNGSREAARATFDAMPFLKAANEVEIFTVDAVDTATQTADMAGVEIAATLARHGINVTVASQQNSGLAPAMAIENRLSDSSIDLLVMGAYGNKRWWEMLFGGVTRTLLDSMTALTLLSR